MPPFPPFPFPPIPPLPFPPPLLPPFPMPGDVDLIKAEKAMIKDLIQEIFR